MAPYSLSACQVVRVFCAVMRAVGASPIMSLGIVFLTGYPTCARPPPPLRFCARAPLASQRYFGSFLAHSTAATRPHKTTTARWLPCAYKATAGS
eukprot:scaffold19679_cov61-Skeletonema_dohrnii-CCMP3373.AAC.1